MRIIHFQASTDALAMIPWPAQLSLIGSLIVTIVVILRWQAMQVQKGNLVSKVEHDRALTQKDTEYERMVAIKDQQIAGEKARADEWHAAQGVSEAAREVERETTKAAVQSNRLLDSFMDRFTAEVAPRTGGASPSRNVPKVGDNTGKEEAR